MITFPGHIVEALKSIPEKDWRGIFDDIVRNKLNQVIATEDDKLASLKAQVIAIEEVRQLFLTERNRVAKVT